MNIDRYRDHIALSFEEGDTVHRLALKKLINIDDDSIIPVSAFHMNGNIRLLYSIEGLRSLSLLKNQLGADKIIGLLHDFGSVLKSLEGDAFITREMIDLSLDNLYFDPENGRLKVCIVPVMNPDQEAGAFAWNKKLFDILVGVFEKILDHQPSEADIPLYGLLHELYKSRESETSVKFICLEKVLEELKKQIPGSGNSDSYVSDDQLIEIRYKGELGVFSFYALKNYFIIGKEDGCDGCIKSNGAISRRHCALERVDGLLYVSDLGSLNHTYVNGRMLESGEKTKVKDHDILRIADMDFEIIF